MASHVPDRMREAMDKCSSMDVTALKEPAVGANPPEADVTGHIQIKKLPVWGETLSFLILLVNPGSSFLTIRNFAEAKTMGSFLNEGIS